MTSKEQAEQGANILRGEFDDVEVGFVDGLFEMYKIRQLIAKYKAEITANGILKAITHQNGSYLFNSNITFRSSWIERLTFAKRIEMDNKKKMHWWYTSILSYNIQR